MNVHANRERRRARAAESGGREAYQRNDERTNERTNERTGIDLRAKPLLSASYYSSVVSPACLDLSSCASAIAPPAAPRAWRDVADPGGLGRDGMNLPPVSAPTPRGLSAAARWPTGQPRLPGTMRYSSSAFRASRRQVLRVHDARNSAPSRPSLLGGELVRVERLPGRRQALNAASGPRTRRGSLSERPGENAPPDRPRRRARGDRAGRLGSKKRRRRPREDAAPAADPPETAEPTEHP